MVTMFRAPRKDYSFIYKGQRIQVKGGYIKTANKGLIEYLESRNRFTKLAKEEVAALEVAAKPQVTSALAKALGQKKESEEAKKEGLSPASSAALLALANRSDSAK